MLWAYWTTPDSTTGKTSFRLVFRNEVVILIEIGELSWRMTQPALLKANKQAIYEELDLVEEFNTQVSLLEALKK